VEITLIANFLTTAIEPGIEEWVGSGLILLMRGNIDGAVGIEVMVGADGNAASTQVCAGIGHRCVDGVGAEEPMIGAEDLEAASEAGADVLSLGGEDKEDIVDAG